MSPLLILHLSDLHFGHKSRFAGQPPVELASSFHQAVEVARERLGYKAPVGLVIVTGDLVEAARVDEYKLTHAVLGTLMERCQHERRFCALVPGNHDVELDG